MSPGERRGEPPVALFERLRDWVPELLFLLVTTAAAVWAQGRWLDPTGDPGIWWSLAARIGAGQRHYADLHLQYGPLSPFLLAWAGRPFDFSSGFFLFANWIPAVLAGVLLLRLARHWLTAPERCVVGVLLIAVAILAPGRARLVFSYCPAAVHALVFAVSALLAMGRGLTHPRGLAHARGWALAAGVFAGLGFATKQEIGLAAMLALSVPILTRGRPGVYWALRCFVGFAPVLASSLLYALSTAPASSLAAESHLWPFALTVPEPWGRVFRIAAGMAGPSWWRPVLEAAGALAYYASLVALGSLLLARERAGNRWRIPAALLVLLLATEVFRGFVFFPSARAASLSAVVGFLLAVLEFRRPASAERDLLVALGLFAGLVALRTAFSGDLEGPYSGIAHFGAALAWAVFLFRTLPALLSGGRAEVFARAIWAVLVLAWSISIGWRLSIPALRDPARVPVATRRGPVWMSARSADLFQRLERALVAGQPVLFLPEAHAFDVLLRVTDPSPFLIHMPGWLDESAERKVVSILQRAPPGAIMVFRRATEEFGVRPFGEGFGRVLSSWIDRQYRTDWETETGRFLKPRAQATGNAPER